MKMIQSSRRLRLLVLTSLALLALLLPAAAYAAPIDTQVESASHWGNCSSVYVVQRGDTLYKIARWYGVSARSLTAANNIANPNRIYVGQSLCIPSKGYPSKGYPSKGYPSNGYSNQAGYGCSTWHTVSRGQTLSGISRYYGVSTGSMMQANNMANPNRIYAGQSLCIPAGGGYPSQQPTYPSQQPMYPSQQPTYPSQQPVYPPPAANPAPTTGSTQAAVTISNFAFMPQTLMVPVGTVVTWTNQDGSLHTVTSDSGMWDSGQLGQGQSFSFTFTTAGTFAYHCEIHPSMTGTIEVMN